MQLFGEANWGRYGGFWGKHKMCDAPDPAHTLAGGAKNEKLHSFSCESVPLHSHTRKPAWKPHAKPPVSLNDKFIVRTKFTFHIHKSILFLSPFFFFKHSGSNPVQYRPVLGSVYQAGSYPFVLFVPVSSSSFKYQENIWTRLVHKTLLCFDVVPKNQRDSNSRIRFRFYHQTYTVDSR